MRNPFKFKNSKVAWGACIWFSLMVLFALMTIISSAWWLVPQYICGYVGWKMTFSWLENRTEVQ